VDGARNGVYVHETGPLIDVHLACDSPDRTKKKRWCVCGCAGARKICHTVGAQTETMTMTTITTTTRKKKKKKKTTMVLILAKSRHA
jgi:hypothetical protein